MSYDDIEDNLKDFLKYRGIDGQTISLKRPVSIISDGTALMYVRNIPGKIRLSIDQLRIIVSLCLKMNMKKLYLVTDNTLKNSHAVRFETFEAYLNIEVITIDFLLIRPCMMYLEKPIKLMPNGIELMKKKGIKDPENELPFLSSTDHVVIWMNIKKGQIVEINSGNETIYKFID